jgi:uncharacterized protein (DUF1015 family)
MIVKPFKGIRPPKHLVEQISSRPYDVLNSQEAREEANGNEKSLYRIIRPEIDFPPGTDEHDPVVYSKAAENFKKFQANGWLQQDEKEQYYIYAQTRNGKTQYGIVLCAYIGDYMTGRIRDHEQTRRDKEEDRIKHVRINNANIEPVFFTYPDNVALNAMVAKYTENEPEYDFVAAPEYYRHTFWVVQDDADIHRITKLFATIPTFYIADGHHRSAAAAVVGTEKARINPNHRGDEEYYYFLAVCFPASQLTIIDYNRVVKDLNGLTDDEFLKTLSTNFIVEKKGTEIFKPNRLHEFSLYLAGNWYTLTAKVGTYDNEDPVGVLDVTISSNLILDEILGIKDLRSDKRIDFVGGIRGLGELKRRVDSGEMKMALALYPVTMPQIIDISDSGNIMPPKTTWFEPKLRSGLVIHSFD